MQAFAPLPLVLSKIVSNDVIAFGPFRLLAAQRVLLEQDRPIRLGSRAFDILMFLIEHAGEVVTKEQLTARIWPTTFVDEANLRVHIAALRRALGEQQSGLRYLANIPGRGYCFLAPVTRQTDSTASPPPAAMGHQAPALPLPLTRVVGRDDIIAKLVAQFQRQRLIVIVGPGGIGKTTVSLAVADALSPSYADGVRFVDLAPIATSALVASALAAVLGLPIQSKNPVPDLIASIKNKRMALVFDSCEHVLDGVAALVEAILRDVPGISILATSREPLRAAGEQLHRLSPLDIPPPAMALTAEDAMAFPSVQLFVERAAERLDGFALNDDDAPVVANICRRLDGIALAIELAASRVDSLGIRGLAARLNDVFHLLTQGRRTALPRHQTMAAALDWSHTLLSDLERVVLRRVGAFAGGFTADAAIALVSDTPPMTAEPHVPAAYVLDSVADLVAKSLVVADVGGAVVRYRFLETMRAYALDKLNASGERESMSRRHANYFRDVFERAEADLTVLSRDSWVAAYGSMIDDVRSALEWSFTNNGAFDIGVRLTIAAVPLWFHLSLMEECCTWMERAVASLHDGTTGDLHRDMRLFAALATALPIRGPGQPATEAAHRRSLEIAENLGDADYQLRALRGLWASRINSDALAMAQTFAETFAAVAAKATNPTDRLIGDRMIGVSLHLRGDQAKAREHIERMLASYVEPVQKAQIFRFQYDQRVAAEATLAQILWLQGFPDQALRMAKRSVESAKAARHPPSLCYALAQAACPTALLNGDREAAQGFIALLTEQAITHALALWAKWARCFDSLMRLQDGGTGDAGDRFVETVANLPVKAPNLRFTASIAQLAEGLIHVGDITLGLDVINNALGPEGLYDERWYIAELLRLKGEVALIQNQTDVAEHYFRKSLDWARTHETLSWELRSATSLAQLWRRQNRLDDGRTLLKPIMARFTEGFATRDWRAAETFMAL